MMTQNLFLQTDPILNEDDALKTMRNKAWDTFNLLGLPTSENEVYKYIPLHKILHKKFSPSKSIDFPHEKLKDYILPECKDSYLVLINGHYSQEHSRIAGISDKIVFLDMSKASKTYGAFLNNHWNKFFKEEKDPFTLINAALNQEGLFIYAPPNLEVATPLQIIHIVDNLNEDSFITPRIQMFVGKNTNVKIFSTWKSLSEAPYFANQLIDFSIDENAHVFYCHTVLDSGNKSWYFDAVRATLKRNSQFKSINFNNGLEAYRNDYKITLTQEGGNAELDGIWMLSHNKESHTNVLIDHQAPYCTSRQFFKGILKDTSKSTFEGKILVRQIAQKTDAFQLNQNLLLDDRTQAYTKPNLEIFADDVKASHGATIGKLNEEQKFYLRSRGFSESDAKNLLVYGYCEEIIERIELPSLMEVLKKFVQKFVA